MPKRPSSGPYVGGKMGNGCSDLFKQKEVVQEVRQSLHRLVMSWKSLFGTTTFCTLSGRLRASWSTSTAWLPFVPSSVKMMQPCCGEAGPWPAMFCCVLFQVPVYYTGVRKALLCWGIKLMPIRHFPDGLWWIRNETKKNSSTFFKFRRWKKYLTVIYHLSALSPVNYRK